MLTKSRIFRPLLTLAFTLVLGGCYGIYHEGPPLYSSAYYDYPYHYYYYPSVGVYYHLYSGEYYYRRDGYWRHERTLPPHYRLDRKDRVGVWLEDKQPWGRHDEHARKFKPRPDYRPDRRLDQRERRHNEERHQRYRNDARDTRGGDTSRLRR